MKPIPELLAAAVAAMLAASAAGSATPPEVGSEVPFVPGQGSDEQLTDVERDVARAAIEALAAELQVSKESILVDTVRAVDWPDSAIGCPEPDRAYLQVVTPGHKVSLRHEGRIYVVHEAGGKAFVCQKTKAYGAVTPQLELTFGAQMEWARADLAKRLRVAEADIQGVSGVQQSWPDSSLGCPEPGEDYVRRPVDGWVMTLRHGARSYTYHTDLERTIPCPPVVNQ
jgi:hypothetical protein